MEADQVLIVHSTLHLIFHRNKNQHGKTKWWKWLSMLKRSVLNLAVSLKAPSSAGERCSAEVYKQYLATRVIPGCYVAFSVVVADSQFSTLGTVLLATLSQLSRVTGIDKTLKARQRTAKKGGKDDSMSFPIQTSEKEDLGEVFSRLRECPHPADVSEPNTKNGLALGNPSKPSARQSKSMIDDLTTFKKKKKKNKKKNAIDDLFDGLL